MTSFTVYRCHAVPLGWSDQGLYGPDITCNTQGEKKCMHFGLKTLTPPPLPHVGDFGVNRTIREEYDLWNSYFLSYILILSSFLCPFLQTEVFRPKCCISFLFPTFVLHPPLVFVSLSLVIPPISGKERKLRSSYKTFSSGNTSMTDLHTSQSVNWLLADWTTGVRFLEGGQRYQFPTTYTPAQGPTQTPIK
jgi:hypothetical protein